MILEQRAIGYHEISDLAFLDTAQPVRHGQVPPEAGVEALHGLHRIGHQVDVRDVVDRDVGAGVAEGVDPLDRLHQHLGPALEDVGTVVGIAEHP